MPKMKDELQRHTLFLRMGDFEKLSDAFPRSKASYVIRRIVSRYVDSLAKPEPADLKLAQEILQGEDIQL